MATRPVAQLTTLKTPAYVVVGGFGCSRRSYARFCDELRRRTHHRVHFISSARYKRAPKNPEHDYPRAVMLQAHHAIATLERQNMGKVVLFGHSFGVLVALVVAAMRPDLIEDVICMSPPGAHVDGLWLWGRMLGKLAVDARHMVWSKNRTRQWLTWASIPGFLLYVFSNPVRTVAEGWRVSFFRAFELVYPQAQANGFKAPVFCAEDDLLFRASRVRAELARLGITNIHPMVGVSHDVQFHYVEAVEAIIASGQICP